MFIIRNACRSVLRSKGRTILIVIIVAIIATAATIGLAIRQAAQTARDEGLSDTTITATISVDRDKLLGNAKPAGDANGSGSTGSDGADASGDNGSRTPPDFDAMRESLAGKQLTLKDYNTYAKASKAVSDTYYTQTTSLDGTDTFQPVTDDTSSTDTSSTDTGGTASGNNAPQNMGPGGMGGMAGMGGMSSGDFQLVGFSSDTAVANAANGSFTMSSGKVFGYDAASDGDVIISSTLASFNNLAVGDTFTATISSSATTDSDSSSTDEAATHTFTVVGIYTNDDTNSGQSVGPSRSGASDPANAIYTSTRTIDALNLGDDNAAQINYTYVFSDKAHYETFVKDVAKAGLSDDYTVSSADVDQYEASLIPLNNLASFAVTLLIIVLAVGAIVLIVLTLFNVRERKYEIGVLTAIGISKLKVAAQFAVELLVVTAIGLAIGIGIGAVASVPVSNQLLSSQVAQQQSERNSQQAQFGRDMQAGPQNGSQDGSQATPQANSSGTSTDNGDKPTNPPSGMTGGLRQAVNYVSSVQASVNLTVVAQLALIGLGLTLLAALGAASVVMRYEPLQILADRS